WAAEYRGSATVVYGHTAVIEPEWLNNTIDVDTGCVFGGALTALRYPERALVSVPAARTYYEPARPITAAADAFAPSSGPGQGTRVAVVVCRDPDVARQRFGAAEGEIGICLTRTGRRFFDDLALERAVLERIRAALDTVDLWATLDTAWVLLDGELMPWSAKA